MELGGNFLTDLKCLFKTRPTQTQTQTEPFIKLII